jgi:MFS family permease
LAVFKVTNYRRFAAGQSVSLIGSWTQDIAQGLLVWNVTHSSIMLGLVAATRYLPVLIGTPYAGLIVDRHDRRHILMFSGDVANSVLTLAGQLFDVSGQDGPMRRASSLLAPIGGGARRPAEPASAGSAELTLRAVSRLSGQLAQCQVGIAPGIARRSPCATG